LTVQYEVSVKLWWLLSSTRWNLLCSCVPFVPPEQTRLLEKMACSIKEVGHAAAQQPKIDSKTETTALFQAAFFNFGFFAT
jgi:hypothetical protein